MFYGITINSTYIHASTPKREVLIKRLKVNSFTFFNEMHIISVEVIVQKLLSSSVYSLQMRIFSGLNTENRYVIHNSVTFFIRIDVK